MSHDIGHMYTLVAPKHKPYFIPSRLLLQKKKKNLKIQKEKKKL